jgi:hypothetical protein
VAAVNFEIFEVAWLREYVSLAFLPYTDCTCDAMREGQHTWVRQPLRLDEVHGRVSVWSDWSMLLRDHAA